MAFIKKLKAMVTLIPLIFAHCPSYVLSYNYSIYKSTNQDLKCDKCGEKFASMTCGDDNKYFIWSPYDNLNSNFCDDCYRKDYGSQMRKLIKKFVPEFNELKIWSLINNRDFIEQIPVIKNLIPNSSYYENLGKRIVALFFIKDFIKKVIENGIDKYDEFVNS